jgi:hypothetical protein
LGITNRGGLGLRKESSYLRKESSHLRKESSYLQKESSYLQKESSHTHKKTHSCKPLKSFAKSKTCKRVFFYQPKREIFFLAFFYFFTSHKTTSYSKQSIDDNNATEGHLLTRGWRQALIVQVCKYRFHQLVLCKVDSSRFQIKARTPHPQNVISNCSTQFVLWNEQKK